MSERSERNVTAVEAPRRGRDVHPHTAGRGRLVNVEDLACEEVVELVTDYLEDAMAPDERAVLKLHLVWCDWCATYFDQMRETIRLTGNLPEEDVPPPVMGALMETYCELRSR